MGGRGSTSKFPVGGPSPAPRQATLDDYLGGKGTPKDLETAMKTANPHFLESVQNKDKLYTHKLPALYMGRRAYEARL